MQQHRHCQLACPLHSQFAKSLRKYSRNSSTTKFTSTIQRGKSSRSSSYIKPFQIAEQDLQNSIQQTKKQQKNRQYASEDSQSRNVSVNVGKAVLSKKMGKQSQYSLVKNSTITELSGNVQKISDLIDKFKKIKEDRTKTRNEEIRKIEENDLSENPLEGFSIRKESDRQKTCPPTITKYLNYKIYNNRF